MFYHIRASDTNVLIDTMLSIYLFLAPIRIFFHLIDKIIIFFFLNKLIFDKTDHKIQTNESKLISHEMNIHEKH